MVTTLWSIFLCATVLMENQAQMQNDLCGATMKGQKQSLREAVPPEYLMEVQSLLCLLDDRSGLDLGTYATVCLFSSTPWHMTVFPAKTLSTYWWIL